MIVMSRLALLAAVVAVAVLLSCTDDNPTTPEEPDYGAPPADIQWLPVESLFVDFPGKRELSLIYVDAKWCHWCHKMEDSTLCDTGVIRMIWQHFNAARLDLDDSTIVNPGDTLISIRNLARYVYEVEGVPTSVFLTREGEHMGNSAGYRGPDSYIRLLQYVLNSD